MNMKVKLGTVAAALGSPAMPGELILMAQLPVAARVAVKLMRLKKAFMNEGDSVNEGLKKLREEHGIPDKPPKGFEWPEAFGPAADELMETEIDMDIEPVELPPDCPGVTGQMLEALEGIVTVKE